MKSTSFLLLLAWLCQTTAFGQTAPLQKLINDAIAAKQPRLTIPPGTYRLDTTLTIFGAQNLVIDATNVTFVSTQYAGPSTNPNNVDLAVASGNDNLTIQNLTLDCDPLPFTQGTVVANAPDGSWHDVAVHAGYRQDVAYFEDARRNASLILHVVNPTDRRLKYRSSFYAPDSTSLVRPGVLRFWFRSSPDPTTFHNMAVGDYVVTQVGWGYALNTSFNKGLKLVNVTIWSASNNGILDGFSRDCDYQFQIVPGPRPTGATIDRLLSTAGGGMVGGNHPKGPRIHDCTFRAMCDDMINLNTQAQRVARVEPGTNTLVAKAGSYYEPGDTLYIINPVTGRRKATRRVSSVSDDGTQLRINSISNIQPNDLFYTHNRSSSGTRIENCTFENTDGAGINLMTINSVVQNNTLRCIGQAALDVALLFDYYDNGAYPTNILLKNNVIRDVGRSDIILTPTYNICSAISVGYVSAFKPNNLIGNRELRNITIEGNDIDSARVWGLSLGHVTGVQVRCNRIARTNLLDPQTAGAFYNVRPASAVFIFDAQNITFTDTYVELPGPFATDGALVIHPTASAGTIDRRGLFLRSYPATNPCNLRTRSGGVPAETVPSKHRATFPNPVLDVLTLSHLPDAPGRAQLTDAAGRVVRTYEHVPARVWHVVVRDLPAGTYLLRITPEAGQPRTVKFVKE